MLINARSERKLAMVKRLLIVLCAILIGQSQLSAEVLRFAYTKGEKFRMLSTVVETVTVNGRFNNRADILNKIAVEITDTRGDSGYNVATFQTSSRLYGSSGTYELSEDYDAEFWRDARGAFTIDDMYFMPTVRDVPLFPETDVAVGQSWSAPASEVHDFRRVFGMADAFHFPITVNYTYLRNEKRNGVDCAVLSASYTIFYKVPSAPRTTNTYPVRITGMSQQTYWWDLQNKRPMYAEETFDIIFTMASGDEVEYAGKSQGELVEAQPLDKAKVTRDIQNEIDKQKLADTSVRADEQGVTITIENVNFPPNSDTLLALEQEKVRRISEILKKYPDRDILITGHTAGVAGYTEEQHQALSELRARAVGNLLLSLGVRKPSQMTMRGMGDRVPLGDNATEAGRMKNRRVEITILEN
jgi:outer membrane protein OmpA-like peptidoglycan-associated protein